jgi:putative endonuclease
MFTVYVLKSRRNGKRYIGFTSKAASERLKEHNKGSNAWVRQNKPFELIHTEQFENKRNARLRELFLKSSTGRKELDKLLLRLSFFAQSLAALSFEETGRQI